MRNSKKYAEKSLGDLQSLQSDLTYAIKEYDKKVQYHYNALNDFNTNPQKYMDKGYLPKDLKNNFNNAQTQLKELHEDLSIVTRLINNHPENRREFEKSRGSRQPVQQMKDHKIQFGAGEHRSRASMDFYQEIKDQLKERQGLKFSEVFNAMNLTDAHLEKLIRIAKKEQEKLTDDGVKMVGRNSNKDLRLAFLIERNATKIIRQHQNEQQQQLDSPKGKAMGKD